MTARPRGLATAWAQLRARELGSRIESASRLFLGAPYRTNPVGDGRKTAIDPRPIMRFDAFDCQTFIESVLSLALAREPEDVRDLLVAFRYGGDVSYWRRNHFLVAMWAPSARARGLLVDDTRRVAGDAQIEYQREVVDLRELFAQHELVRGPIPDWLATGHTVEASWLSLANIVRAGQPFEGGIRSRGLELNVPLLERVRQGTVFVLRSPGWTDLAFAVRRRGRWVLRHASRGRGMVVEHDLVAMLQTMARFEFVDAISILAPRAQADAGIAPATKRRSLPPGATMRSTRAISYRS